MIRARESFHRTIGKVKVSAKKIKKETTYRARLTCLPPEKTPHGSSSMSVLATHRVTHGGGGVLVRVRELDLSVQASGAEQRGILRTEESENSNDAHNEHTQRVACLGVLCAAFLRRGRCGCSKPGPAYLGGSWLR